MPARGEPFDVARGSGQALRQAQGSLVEPVVVSQFILSPAEGNHEHAQHPPVARPSAGPFGRLRGTSGEPQGSSG